MTRGIYVCKEPTRRNACVRLNNEQREFVRHPRGSVTTEGSCVEHKQKNLNSPINPNLSLGLNSVGVCYRVFENVESRGAVGEKYKEQGEDY